jgi:hypothetical protein
MVIREYNLSKSFWTLYPQFLEFDIFKEMYKKDRRANKPTSSRMMWAIAAFVDITGNNILHNVSDQDKISIIESDYINVKFNKVKYKRHIELMKQLLLPREYRALSDLYNKLEERTKLIRDTEYTIDNAKKLDDLIENTDKLLSTIKKMESSIKAGSDDGITKGNRPESLNEKGII